MSAVCGPRWEEVRRKPRRWSEGGGEKGKQRAGLACRCSQRGSLFSLMNEGNQGGGGAHTHTHTRKDVDAHTRAVFLSTPSLSEIMPAAEPSSHT